MDDPLLPTSPPFRGSEAVRAALTTPDRLRGPAFQHLGPDLYGGADLDPTDVRVRLEVIEEWTRGHGVVAGPLAALALGVDCPWDDGEVVLAVRGGTVLDGIRVRTDRLGPHEVTARGGIRITTPARTAFDLGRRSPLVDAVAAVDALAHHHRFGVAALEELVAEHPRARGLVRLREVLALVDPRAESLMETRTRIGLVVRGVPAPVPQYEVVLPGYGRARLDFAWLRPGPGGERLALEYDGAEHRTIRGQNRDNRRDAALRRAGWRVIHVSSQQVLDPQLADELAREVLAIVRP